MVFVDTVFGGFHAKTVWKSEGGVQSKVTGIVAGACTCGVESGEELTAAFFACARQCPAQEDFTGDGCSALSFVIAQSAQWAEDICITGVIAIP